VKRSVLAIVGMRSNTCREQVAEALGALDCVLDVHVSLVRGCAVVTHRAECSTQALIAAVVQTGFGAEHKSDTD
jgi:copper chaperone CopZ